MTQLHANSTKIIYILWSIIRIAYCRAEILSFVFSVFNAIRISLFTYSNKETVLLYSIYSLYRGEYSITGYSILHILQICCLWRESLVEGSRRGNNYFRRSTAPEDGFIRFVEFPIIPNS